MGLDFGGEGGIGVRGGEGKGVGGGSDCCWEVGGIGVGSGKGVEDDGMGGGEGGGALGDGEGVGRRHRVPAGGGGKNPGKIVEIGWGVPGEGEDGLEVVPGVAAVQEGPLRNIVNEELCGRNAGGRRLEIVDAGEHVTELGDKRIRGRNGFDGKFGVGAGGGEVGGAKSILGNLTCLGGIHEVGLEMSEHVV